MKGVELKGRKTGAGFDSGLRVLRLSAGSINGEFAVTGDASQFPPITIETTVVNGSDRLSTSFTLGKYIKNSRIARSPSSRQ